MQKQSTLVYVPALHAGILSFLSESEGNIWVLGEEVIALIDAQFDYLRKEIRALSPEHSARCISVLMPHRTVAVLTTHDLKKLNTEHIELLLPREDIFHWLAKTHLSKARCLFSPTFLRWNRENTIDETTVAAPMAEAIVASQQSSDWWRQVGCALVKNGQIVSVAHNHHLPSPYTPYIDSDPRNSFHKGEQIDLSTAIHAEAALIAHAARTGESLIGAELYVTTFPCPTCAKLVAASGISTIYFLDGYSMLDGEKVLKDAGVQVFRIHQKKVTLESSPT